MSTEEQQFGPGSWGMRTKRDDPPAKRILWGVFLIVVGGLLLMARLDYVDIPSIWKFWPMVFVAIGAGHLLERRPGGAASMLLMGLSFFAAEFRWLGLSYHTFWPLLVISVGVGLVLRSISREDDGRARKWA